MQTKKKHLKAPTYALKSVGQVHYLVPISIGLLNWFSSNVNQEQWRYPTCTGHLNNAERLIVWQAQWRFQHAKRGLRKTWWLLRRRSHLDELGTSRLGAAHDPGHGTKKCFGQVGAHLGVKVTRTETIGNTRSGLVTRVRFLPIHNTALCVFNMRFISYASVWFGG